MTVAENTPVTINRNERILAYMVASSIGLSVICIFATLVSSTMDVDYSVGIWQIVTVLPIVGLPIGFILMITLLVIATVRRSRAARDASQ